MNNIIQLNKSQGFTRMDNDLYEALIGADLSGRELRVALAIHRYTAGYSAETARIPAVNIAKLSGIARENVSRIIGELIRQRVIYRAGGSKAPIGIAPFAEWKIDAKNDDKKATSKTTQSVKSDTSLVSFLTHIKEKKEITTSKEVVRTPEAEPKPKTEKKPKRTAVSLEALMANNPHDLSTQLVEDWLKLRKERRATVSDTVWAALNAELTKCVAAGFSADDAMTEALVAGWQGFKADWVIKRLAKDSPNQARNSNAPDFHSGDTSWASDLGDL